MKRKAESGKAENGKRRGIIGYGNPGRLDDGLGSALADVFQGLENPSPEFPMIGNKICAATQLLPSIGHEVRLAHSDGSEAAKPLDELAKELFFSPQSTILNPSLDVF